MKKIYITPETTVVALNVRDNVLQAGSKFETTSATPMDADDAFNSRETVRSQGAWEEW